MKVTKIIPNTIIQDTQKAVDKAINSCTKPLKDAAETKLPTVEAINLEHFQSL